MVNLTWCLSACEVKTHPLDERREIRFSIVATHSRWKWLHWRKRATCIALHVFARWDGINDIVEGRQPNCQIVGRWLSTRRESSSSRVRLGRTKRIMAWKSGYRNIKHALGQHPNRKGCHLGHDAIGYWRLCHWVEHNFGRMVLALGKHRPMCC